MDINETFNEVREFDKEACVYERLFDAFRPVVEDNDSSSEQSRNGFSMDGFEMQND